VEAAGGGGLERGEHRSRVAVLQPPLHQPGSRGPAAVAHEHLGSREVKRKVSPTFSGIPRLPASSPRTHPDTARGTRGRPAHILGARGRRANQEAKPEKCSIILGPCGLSGPIVLRRGRSFRHRIRRAAAKPIHLRLFPPFGEAARLPDASTFHVRSREAAQRQESCSPPRAVPRAGTFAEAPGASPRHGHVSTAAPPAARARRMLRHDEQIGAAAKLPHVVDQLRGREHRAVGGDPAISRFIASISTAIFTSSARSSCGIAGHERAIVLHRQLGLVVMPPRDNRDGSCRTGCSRTRPPCRSTPPRPRPREENLQHVHLAAEPAGWR